MTNPWVRERFALAALEYPIPARSNRLDFMLGALTLVALTLLGVTGIVLTQFYATVGIAIGAGTDVAIETAGIILMKDDPADVPVALVLARRVHRKIKQNLFWAAIYNLIAIPLAAGVLYPSLGILLKPAWAALAMSASTVTVTVNALLLRPPEHTQTAGP